MSRASIAVSLDADNYLPDVRQGVSHGHFHGPSHLDRFGEGRLSGQPRDKPDLQLPGEPMDLHIMCATWAERSESVASGGAPRLGRGLTRVHSRSAEADNAREPPSSA
jgi:hypothetical protein